MDVVEGELLAGFTVPESPAEGAEMPNVIAEVNPSGSTSGERTFSERVVTQSLQSGHYSSQLLERLK
jgi:hypothetical protein